MKLQPFHSEYKDSIMPRYARMVLAPEEKGAYHIISRTYLPGFCLGDVEKEYLFKLLKDLTQIYFTKVYAFCIMGNHFHLLLEMEDGHELSDKEVYGRILRYYPKHMHSTGLQQRVQEFRERFMNISIFVQDLKQRFSRWYNKRNQRKGFFWGERFKSVLVEKGINLLRCMAYIDLNPIRANMVKKPENYRWSSLGYRAQTANRENWLSLEHGFEIYSEDGVTDPFSLYRSFVYERAEKIVVKGACIDRNIHESEKKKGFQISKTESLTLKSRYFSESLAIGSKGFIKNTYSRFQTKIGSSTGKREPVAVNGFDQMFVYKRLNGI